MKKRIVVVESPFAGDVPRNLRFLRACLRDCLQRDEAPYASHAIYTQPGVLDDGDPADRKLGMEAGFRFKDIADVTVVYTNLSISPGMQAGIDASLAAGYRYEYRELAWDWESGAIALEKTFKTRWPEQRAKDEVAWLIEDIDVSRAWWDGDGMTSDPNKAVRFARKEDAQRVIDERGFYDKVATEHMWCA